MKYIVAPGASFVAKGNSYGPGDTIDSSLFSPEALKRALKISERFPHGKLIAKEGTEQKPSTVPGTEWGTTPAAPPEPPKPAADPAGKPGKS